MSEIAYAGDLVQVDPADSRVFELDWDALALPAGVTLASHSVTVRGIRPAGVTIVSITRAAAVATVVVAEAHGLTTGDRVTVAGAAQKEYNGTVAITVVDTVTFTYAVSDDPASPATGALSYSQGLEADHVSLQDGDRIGQVRLTAKGIDYLNRRYEVAHRVVTDEAPAQTLEQSFYVEVSNQR